MILGKIVGKLSTTEFDFVVSSYAKKFDYVQVFHKDHGYTLCQIVELIRENSRTLAKCIAIGFKDNDGRVKQIRTPFYAGDEVLLADDEFIKTIIQLAETGAYVGLLEGRNIPVYLNLNNLLTKHVAVLAKSGAGKSYAVGVLLEEIMEKKVPLIILDPHGEYTSLKFPNDSDNDLFPKFNISPKGYGESVREYSPDNRFNKDAIPLKLDSKLNSVELLHILPAKLSSAQSGILYAALKNLNLFSFDELISELEEQESGQKWSIINMLDYLRKLKVFSAAGTDYSELVKPGKCSVINFKGVDPVIQEIVAYKLLKDLYMLRKSGSIPPFFLVVEEAHNFCPERGFGEKKSSTILRDLASEGRKFGLGLCVISQRPARVEKSIISQCSTQLILKLTNPNDLKAVSTSVEGITNETEREIRNLPVGSALVTGVVDLPLMVNVRVRKSKHGGEAVKVIEEDAVDVLKEVENFKEDDLVPVILPKTSTKDLKVMHGDVNIKTFLVPSVMLTCEKGDNEFNLLFDLYKGELITAVENGKHFPVPIVSSFSIQEVAFIEEFVKNSGVKPQDMALSDQTVDTILHKFYSMNLLEHKNGQYVLSDSLNCLHNPSAYSTFEKIEFKNLKYDVKLNPKLSAEDIAKKFGDKLAVKEHKECFIVVYDIVK